jgi:hypothetical protein
MNSTHEISFADLRRLLESIGYRHKHTDGGEVFYISRDRMLLFRCYRDDDTVRDRDLRSTKSFLDDWNQMQAADFDAFLESKTRPA